MRSSLIISAALLISITSVLSQSKENVRSKPIITFIELGSVKCIPCKKMQPVMKAIENKYGEQVKVIFYDVWTKEQQPFSEKYKIRLIPTQVFLDENDKEFFRHEGYYAEEDIDKLFSQRGIIPKKTGK